jgi:hypothetical protein
MVLTLRSNKKAIKSDRKLKPSVFRKVRDFGKAQCNKLQELIPSFKFINQTPKTVARFIKNTKITLNYGTNLNPEPVDIALYLFFMPLFSPMTSKFHLSILDEHGGHTEDIEKRCDLIMSKKHNQIKTLLTMDGHGRIIGRMISKFENICVYELDRGCHKWHSKFFPKDISFFGNIFDAIDTHIENKTIESVLIYLNFCGIGEQSEAVLQCITKIQTYDETNGTHCIDNLIISFSRCRAGIRIANNLVNELKQWRFEEKTKRQDFVTMSRNIQ